MDLYLTVKVEIPDEAEELSPKLVTYLDLVSRTRRRTLRQKELEELLKGVMQFYEAGGCGVFPGLCSLHHGGLAS